MGHTINGVEYANLQKQLGKAIKNKPPDKLTKVVLYRRENVP